MTAKRVTIIQDIHGKITRDGKVSEPDIYYILEKWLERHPEFKGRERDIRIVSGRCTTQDGLKTELISASIIAYPEIAGYDPAQDADLYEYFLAEEREA
jgi:hypothetical protein